MTWRRKTRVRTRGRTLRYARQSELLRATPRYGPPQAGLLGANGPSGASGTMVPRWSYQSLRTSGTGRPRVTPRYARQSELLGANGSRGASETGRGPVGRPSTLRVWRRLRMMLRVSLSTNGGRSAVADRKRRRAKRPCG